MQVKGSFNNSCFLQDSTCSVKEIVITLPDNLRTRRNTNLEVLQKMLHDSLCKRRAQGLLSLPECSRKGPGVIKSCLWFSRRVVVHGILLETATEACAQRRSKPVVRGRVFSSVWSMLVSSAPGQLCLGGCFYCFSVCFGRVPGRNKTAGVQAVALSLFTSRGGLLCKATYLPAREVCSYNGNLTDCICFVLVWSIPFWC